ncbi:hypothetical protein WR25_09037 [Diploscapter pachys]|uniref:RecF/RecN/SMC N-terminal domain-containing protein n=1 Tax=Diploscapter pachys TaxID=2018661 RepID=A0A2A2K6A7_9BILA|nr:hypothetical protein WR25_09037 [Diploscapter pachys]
MHITKLIITDFLSYKGRIEITDFSQHLNLLSLSTIEFVLTDSYKNVRERDRLSLINQSSTAQRPNFCKVEIVLDNSDKSIPLTDYPKKVTIARMMDKKKDKLTINDKVVTHKELRSLLIASGFSTTSAYYIVQQGQVCRLASTKEKLLNEYCGNSQFIVTTFHPELLGPAEVRFGVKFINKIHNSSRPLSLSLCTSQSKQIDLFPPQQTLCNALEFGQKQKEKSDCQKELQQSRAQGFSRSRSHNDSRSRSSSGSSRSSRRSRSVRSKKDQAKGRKTVTRLRDARGRFVSMGGARKSNKKSSRKSTKSARSRRSKKGSRRAMRKPAEPCPQLTD